MAEQDLDDASVDAILDQPSRIAVPQDMRCDATLDPRSTGGGSEGKGQHLVVEGGITVATGEQPTRVAMGPPKMAEFVEHRLWQRHKPLLVAFANNSQHLVGSINGTDLQSCGLADAKTACIHGSEAGLVDGVADSAEQQPDLLIRQRVRQSLLAW